jgi:hypothetical protein
VNITISEGTKPYQIFVNGDLLFTTMLDQFDLNVTHGSLVEVYSSKSCEGQISEVVKFTDNYTSIHPNPFATSIVLRVPYSLIDQQLRLQVFDPQGKLVKEVYDSSSGMERLLNLYDLSDGLYYLTIMANDLHETHRIVKK